MDYISLLNHALANSAKQIVSKRGCVVINVYGAAFPFEVGEDWIFSGG